MFLRYSIYIQTRADHIAVKAQGSLFHFKFRLNALNKSFWVLGNGHWVVA
jgi:hypothetical protein